MARVVRVVRLFRIVRVVWVVRVVRVARLGLRERLVTNLEKPHFCICCCLRWERLKKCKSKVDDPLSPWVP